jgi:hypothetical protein
MPDVTSTNLCPPGPTKALKLLQTLLGYSDPTTQDASNILGLQATIAAQEVLNELVAGCFRRKLLDLFLFFLFIFREFLHHTPSSTLSIIEENTQKDFG